jgi:glycosyltransferase involved in cell wall biosynthesis
MFDMRISILINNFNYARYLGAAIDSALAQVGSTSGAEVEVIVCDDASTDGSREVMARYGSCIQTWHSPENRGQASAMNAGLALSTGEWVLFLDADDLLEPDALATCLPLMAEGVAKIQFQLQCITQDGRPMGRQIPYLLHDGDVRPLIARFGTYGGPPSSGNLYRRSAIQRYFPLDEPAWRRAADTPPFLLSAFNGRIVNAPRPLGAYRIHSSVNRARGCFGNISARHGDMLRIEAHRRTTALALLASRDGIDIPNPPLHAPWNLRSRALSLRTEPQRHPYPDDTLASLMQMQADSLAACPGYTWSERRAAQLWLLAVLLVPTSWATRMAISNTSSRIRRWFRQLRAHLA